MDLPQGLDTPSAAVDADNRPSGARRDASIVLRSSELIPLLSESDADVCSRLVGSAGVGIYVAPVVGPLRMANQSLADLLGYESPNAVYVSVEQEGFDPYFEPSRRRELLEALRCRGHVTHFESLVRRADDSIIWVVEHIAARRGPDGQIVEYQGIMADATAIKSAEQAVRDAEANYRGLFEHSTVGIVQMTPSGRLLSANPAFARLFGYASVIEAMEDTRDFSGAWRVDPSVRREICVQLERHGSVTNCEVAVQKPNGGTAWVSASLGLVHDTLEETQRVEGTFVDITARKLAESALERRVALEQLLHAISTRFINLHSRRIGSEIQNTLAMVGRFLEVDRVFIAEADRESEDWKMTYWWAAEKLPPQLDGESLPLGTLAWMRERLMRIESVHIKCMDDATDRADEFLQRRGAHSFLIVPVQYSGALVGAIGAETTRPSRHLHEDATFLLQMVGEIATSALEHTRAEEAIRRSEQKLSVLVQETPLAVVEWDPQFRILDWNRAAERIFGYARAEILGADALDLFPDATSRREAQDLWRELLDGQASNRHASENIRADGQSIVCEWYNTALRDGSGKVIGGASMAQDITKRKHAEARLFQQALHDALTGLPNRSLFTERLDRRLAAARQNRGGLFAVLFLDLDRFKIINDSLGHPIGDKLLIEISARLERALRTSDFVSRGENENTVARLGGDEFTILLDSLPNEHAVHAIAQRIQEVVREPFVVEGHKVYTTASIGVAIGGPEYSSAGDVLRDADIAMYEAKSQGKSRHEVFDMHMRSRAMERLETETSLRHGIERNEFIVHYQPIVRFPSRRIEAVEALVRWEHPTRGRLGPDAFLPLAEETGLILPIGDWVIEEACRQMKRWQDLMPQHPPLRLCVNLSGKQFKRPGLANQLLKVVEDAGLAPHCLGVEITESELMLDARPTITILNQLNECGFALSIDDFGTGYSSLSHLHCFPPSSLKIDRTFVSGMDGSGNMAIVRAITSVAKSLGKTVIAEGVESETQVERLRELDCSLFQGNWIHPVSSASKMTEILRQSS